ncbi:hypothetical protein BDZ45DRAFT_329744 [Acephala macrosclerotiorum]|nr:hypothetical protein BDZ45DRAFT_329744 [Acephala macrosclerotiorum]
MFKRILREQRGEILRTANLTFTSDPEIIWMTNRRLFSIAFRDTGDTFVSPEAHQKGYSRVSVYMNSDNDTILSRRFDALHPRLLLYLQVEITDLESQLKELDDEELLNKTTQRNKSDRDDNGSKYGSKYSISAQYAEASYNYAISETRQHLLKERLKNCDTAPRQLSRPSKRVHQNSKDRTETDNSFEGGEKQFIFHESDFVVPNSQREDSWLDEFIHRAIIPRRLRLRPGISVGSHNRTPIPSKGRQKLFKFLKNCIQLLTSGLAFTLPLSLIRHANGATIPSAAPTIPILPDPVSSSGPSVGEAISALLIAIVGIVVWHCVKHSPKRRPYLIISLLIVAWIYSTVVANGGGMWPISSLWLCSLVNVLLLVREDMLDLNLGLR